MKTAISVPDELFQEAEQVAKNLRVSRSELYRRALETYLQANSQRLITEALNQVYAAPSGESRLDPLLEELQCASIPHEEW